MAVHYDPPPKLVAPPPPHRDYMPRPDTHPSDGHIKDDNEDPYGGLSHYSDKHKKKRPLYSIKPVNHDLFKHEKTHKLKATLPYKPTEPFLELSRAINQVRKAVLKVKPVKAMASNAFNQFTIGVKSRIKNMRGPYGYSYPTGYYDFK